MNEIFIIITGSIVVSMLLFYLSRSIAHRQKVNKELESLSDQMEQIKDTIEQTKDMLDNIHYNTLSSVEKEELAFENARAFSLSDVRQLKQSDTLHLISLSYIYPQEEPLIDRFEYKHDHLDESLRTQFGCPVHGFWRFSPSEDWTPYEFLATNDECNTTSCEGTIKRLR